MTTFCEWVRERSHQFRGITYGTMLRDEAFHFLRLGTFLERADNTARLLGVRATGVKAGSTDADADDQMHWGAVLKSVSAFKAFRTVHGDNLTPLTAVDLLVMRDDMPRSLHACLDQVSLILAKLNPSAECARLAGAGLLGAAPPPQGIPAFQKAEKARRIAAASPSPWTVIAFPGCTVR